MRCIPNHFIIFLFISFYAEVTAFPMLAPRFWKKEQISATEALDLELGTKA
jgi:hypothetical protein